MDAPLTARDSELIEQFCRDHPTKLLVFVLTDVVESMDLKSQLGDAPALALMQQHERLLDEALREIPDAQRFDPKGDGYLLVFLNPSDAIRFALRSLALHREARAEQPLLPHFRVGTHLGTAMTDMLESAGGSESTIHDVRGLHVDTAGRVRDLAAADQILCSRAVFDDARHVLRGVEIPGVDTLTWLVHGPYVVKGRDETLEICEVGEAGAAPLARPVGGAKAWPAARSEEELGWRPAAGVTIPGTNWELQQRLGEETPTAGEGGGQSAGQGNGHSNGHSAGQSAGRPRFRGEFGEIWKARNPQSHAVAAFKFCFKTKWVKVLKREARLLQKLGDRLHPGLVRVQDVTVGERPPHYLQMEYVEGPTMEEWLATDPPLRARLDVMAEVAEALATAHAEGIYHRDIKPGNILLARQPDGSVRAKLSDFGLGAADDPELLKSLRLSTVEGIVGTWDYIAPEARTAGAVYTAQSDIYSLGLTLYQVVTGNLDRPLPPDWTNNIQSPFLRKLIVRSMMDRPRERWPSANMVADGLRRDEAAVAPPADAANGAEPQTTPSGYRPLAPKRYRKTAPDEQEESAGELGDGAEQDGWEAPGAGQADGNGAERKESRLQRPKLVKIDPDVPVIRIDVDPNGSPYLGYVKVVDIFGRKTDEPPPDAPKAAPAAAAVDAAPAPETGATSAEGATPDAAKADAAKVDGPPAQPAFAIPGPPAAAVAETFARPARPIPEKRMFRVADLRQDPDSPVVDLFSGLGPKQLGVLRHCARIESYGKGQLIHRIDEPADGLSVIVDGGVEIFYETADGECILAELGPNDIFGEVGLLLDTKLHIDSARAMQATVISKMPFDPVTTIAKYAQPEESITFLTNLMTLMRRRLDFSNALPAAKTKDSWHSYQHRRIWGDEYVKRIRREFELAGLFKSGVKRRLQAGEYLLHKGERATEFYYILKGSIAVLDGDGGKVEAILNAPCIAGEDEFFTDTPRVTSIQVRTPLAYSTFDFNQFNALFKKNPQGAVKMIQAALHLLALTIMRRQRLGS